jgi:hypothetical protein
MAEVPQSASFGSWMKDDPLRRQLAAGRLDVVRHERDARESADAVLLSGRVKRAMLFSSALLPCLPPPGACPRHLSRDLELQTGAEIGTAIRSIVMSRTYKLPLLRRLIRHGRTYKRPLVRSLGTGLNL